PTAVHNAESTVQRATINLCIAQQLRTAAPGAANGEILLFPGDEQRRLLEITRERAQLAMLQFAGLAAALSATASASDPPPKPNAFLPVFARWQTTADPQLVQLGEDFAHAVNLHITTSGEIAALLVRSGDARLPRGASATTTSDELWGPGSWRNR